MAVRFFHGNDWKNGIALFIRYDGTFSRPDVGGCTAEVAFPAQLRFRDYLGLGCHGPTYGT
jgi:hypothetical protein